MIERENDPHKAYHSTELSDEELAEFESTHKLKYTRRGAGVDKPGEYVEFWTKDGSKLRGKVISSRKIDGLNTEVEVEYEGD